jgi:hypothetical protein
LNECGYLQYTFQSLCCIWKHCWKSFPYSLHIVLKVFKRL